MSGTKPSQKVESVSEFLEKIAPLTEYRDLGADTWIFRGQQQTRKVWKLLPKVGREDWFGAIFSGRRESHFEQAGMKISLTQSIRAPGVPPDRNLFQQWYRRAVAYRADFPSLEIDQLALAQHYGLATRLLDWSRNPLAALFFAVEDDEAHDGALYALLEPKPLPSELSLWEATLWPLSTYEPRPIDRRMLAQAALFTLHSSPEQPIEPTPIGSVMPDGELTSFHMIADLRSEIQEIGVDLVEFVIPGLKKRDVRANLAALGMTRETLFPDLEGLSAQFNFVHRTRAEDFLTRFQKGITVEAVDGSTRV